MSILFLVPDIHDLQTGGNVFNRRIVEALRPETSIQVVSWAPEDTPASGLDLSGTDVILVDSLLARHPAAIQAVAEARPSATVVLLVHYLHCVDPHASDSEAAADERRTLDTVDAAIAPSQFVRRALIDEGMPANRASVVRPGLHERYRDRLPAHLRQGPPRILTVANLLPAKGLRSFVEVLRDLRELSWTWTLVGDASLDPECAEAVFRRLSAAGLSGRVVWTGPVSPGALRVAYDRADLFVLPSRFETCSLSTREAMARGLPVVGYRGGGMPENIGDAAAGHLVPPGNDRALRAALRFLLSDPMARAQKGRAAWHRSRTFPTWEEAGCQFRSVLQVLALAEH
jgi:glycosyltransferase involved in cell wall biosynthesis